MFVPILFAFYLSLSLSFSSARARATIFSLSLPFPLCFIIKCIQRRSNSVDSVRLYYNCPSLVVRFQVSLNEILDWTSHRCTFPDLRQLQCESSLRVSVIIFDWDISALVNDDRFPNREQLITTMFHLLSCLRAVDQAALLFSKRYHLNLSFIGRHLRLFSSRRFCTYICLWQPPAFSFPSPSLSPCVSSSITTNRYCREAEKKVQACDKGWFEVIIGEPDAIVFVVFFPANCRFFSIHFWSRLLDVDDQAKREREGVGEIHRKALDRALYHQTPTHHALCIVSFVTRTSLSIYTYTHLWMCSYKPRTIMR